jgi:hypothetical protein
MRVGTKFILLSIFLSNQVCFGQKFEIDSCGFDSNPILNQYEIAFFDSIMFAPYISKKSGIIDPKEGFDFKHKRLAFFSCSINSNHNGEGLISKKDFFEIVKPGLKGHAGRGLIIFNENEKEVSKGFDAVIIIDCPFDINVKEEIMSIMTKRDI